MASLMQLGSPPPSHSQTPPTTTSRRVDEAKTHTLSTLKDTDWPKEVTHDVQALIDTMGTLPDLSKIPADETQIRTELKVSIKLLIKELESVRTKLGGESKRYGTRKKGFRKGVKKLFSRNDASECSRVLKACRNDVEESSATLNSLLSNLDTENEEQGQPGNSNGLLGTQTPTVTTVLAPTAVPSPVTNTAQPNNSPIGSQSTPQVSQVASVGPGKQTGSSRRGELLNGANKTFKFAEGVSGALPVVGTYVGAVAKVGLTAVEMVQAMDENNETAERLGAHVCRLSKVLETFSTQPRQPESQTANGMEDLQQALRDVQREIAEQNSQPGLKKFWNSSDQSGSLKKLQDKVRIALEEIQLLVNLKTSILVDELHNESTQNRYHRLLDRLGDGKYSARGEVIEDVTCLPGTRVEILKRIDDWIRGVPSSERVLWIRGMAGRGKSTIASTVAHSWKDRACCAIYHFRRGQNISNASLVCALARQLARSLDPELRKAILSTVEEKDDVINQRLDEQFDALFAASLRTLKAKASPILVIIDALDECDSVDYAVNFVKIIDRCSPSLPDNLKFLLTSRPEAPLIRTLELRKWRTESLDSLDDADADIELFLSHSLSQVKAEHEIPEDWPTQADIPRLAKMSQGLFQWARTVVKYINDGSPTDQLAEVLESPAVWSGVDELYAQILSRALERAKQHSAKENLLLTLLATLVVAPYPVSLEVITFLHTEHDLIKGKRPETVFNFLRRGILADLNSLLFIPASSTEPIRLIHTSIRDLLVDRGRCKGQPYWVDLVEHHQRLAAACIRRMNQNLRANICNLTDLSKSSFEVQDIVEREVSKGIQYCCRSWSIHLTKCQQALRLAADDQLPQELNLKSFSEEKILFWLEIMSLVGSANEAIIMAKEAHQWLSRNPDGASGSSSLATLWNDVYRLTTAFADPIAFGPLHIYASALSHCPVKAELWKRYSTHATVVTIRGVQPPTWSPDLWTRPVGGNVHSVAFSPDSTRIALGCGDEVIRLLDPHSGRQIRQPLTGHGDFVRSVCFSPDGKLLASGSDDETVRRWDPQTGSQVGEALTGHSAAVKSVCFSPDGRLLASGSDDKTIRLWDPQTGRQIGEPLSGHRDRVNSVCFSPSGKLLVSGSRDDTIGLWDPQTGMQVSKPLTGHSNTIESVCFSPDGKLLASGSWDNTIRLWDPQTGSQVGEPLTGHSQAVCSVCFSADGRLLASGSRDYTVRLWDPATGGQTGEPFTRHSGVIQTVCFSPDGKHLASGSTDGTARLWDPQTGSQAIEPLTGHSSAIEIVCFSPDGKLLASGAWDRTIRLWESQTGNPVGQPLTGHDGIVQSVCFSADGKLLASGSWDMTIRLWDPQTGSQVGEPLRGHDHTVSSVCFSPDGKLLASGSDDNRIRLWDSQTGSQVGEALTGHTHSIRSVCFSPDGKLLASRSYDNTIRLWNPQTGRQVGQPLTGYDSRFRSLWFSPDGRYVAGQIRDGNAIAWDVVSCQPCDNSSFISPAPTVSYDDHWVTLSSSRLFWLPSQYWSGPRCQVTLCNGKLAVVHDQTLSIFDLSGALSLYNPSSL